MGLSQHERLQHPQVRNEKRKKQAQGTGRKGRLPTLLTDQEFEQLKHYDRIYQGHRQINAEIRQHFPYLTCKQISDLRRRINRAQNTTSSDSDNENDNVNIDESGNDRENENQGVNIIVNENRDENENANENEDLTMNSVKNEAASINASEENNKNEHVPISINQNINESENEYVEVVSSDTDEFVDASSEIPISEAVDNTPALVPEEADNYKTELIAQIRESARMDARWAATHEAIIRASDEECTRPRTHAQRKRYIYARTQDMYNNCPKKLSDLVVENDFSLLEKTDLPEKDAVAKLYDELWGQTGPENIDWNVGTPDTLLRTKDIFRPIEAVEVRIKINKLANDVASGLDGIKKTHLKLPDTDYLLAKYFNLLLLKSYYPNDWKQNRTTLIPKVGRDRRDVKNWRPITIGSLVGRLFSGLLDKRLRACITQYPRQKGFSDENGCYINTTTLNCAIRMAKQIGGVVGVTDIEKAFDTVSHPAISKALQRKGVPEIVVS
ncbi:uncharacterized protein LOC143266154 [Megachile rotundata]|uniref:uncharacterized protein LOC143266154 n=1 Tax=Megachile rotundata TaxID=143995 RepID=UPI003FD01262